MWKRRADVAPLIVSTFALNDRVVGGVGGISSIFRHLSVLSGLQLRGSLHTRGNERESIVDRRNAVAGDFYVEELCVLAVDCRRGDCDEDRAIGKRRELDGSRSIRRAVVNHRHHCRWRRGRWRDGVFHLALAPQRECLIWTGQLSGLWLLMRLPQSAGCSAG